MASALRLAVLIGLCIAAATAGPARKGPSSVLQFLASRPDAQVVTSLLSRFPYLQQLLADPNFTGTYFLAPDKGWQAYKQVQSTAQVLAKIARELEHSMNPDMDTRESIFARMYWRQLNGHIVPNHRITPKMMIHGATWKTALERGDRVGVARKGSLIVVGNWYNVTDLESGTPDFDPLDPQFGGAKVVASFNISSKAIVYELDGILRPEVAGPDSYRMSDVWPRELSYALEPAEGPERSNPMSFWTGPYARLQEPVMTVFWPSDEALHAYFANARAVSATPSSYKDLADNPQLLAAFLSAHTVPGLRLWQWDLLNKAVLSKGVAPANQLTMLNGDVLNVTMVPQKGSGFHEVFLTNVISRKIFKVSAVMDIGGNELNCELSGEQGCVTASVILELDGVNFPYTVNERFPPRPDYKPSGQLI